MEVSGKGAVKDIVQGIKIVEAQPAHSPEQEHALAGLYLANNQLEKDPDHMRSVYFRIGDEFQLVKTGLHRLITDLNLERTYRAQRHARRVENLLSQMVVRRELE